MNGEFRQLMSARIGEPVAFAKAVPSETHRTHVPQGRKIACRSERDEGRLQMSQSIGFARRGIQEVQRQNFNWPGIGPPSPQYNRSHIRRIILVLACSFSIAATGNAYAEVINFDSLPTTGAALVPNGYEGFNWVNFAYLTSAVASNSGYRNGLVSSPNVGFCGFDPASFTTVDDSAFTLTSLFLTGAWNDGLNVLITGTRNGFVVWTQSFIVSTAGPTLETLDWTGIDTVLISTSGGTNNPNFGGSGEQVVVDDITISATSAVPEPGTLGMVGSGVLALAGAIRRRLTV